MGNACRSPPPLPTLSRPRTGWPTRGTQPKGEGHQPALAAELGRMLTDLHFLPPAGYLPQGAGEWCLQAALPGGSQVTPIVSLALGRGYCVSPQPVCILSASSLIVGTPSSSASSLPMGTPASCWALSSGHCVLEIREEGLYPEPKGGVWPPNEWGCCSWLPCGWAGSLGVASSLAVHQVAPSGAGGVQPVPVAAWMGW